MTDKFIFSGLYYLMNRKAIRKYALIKLYNEINFNLKIIDVLKWKGITDFEKLRLCSHFRTHDIEEYLKFISTDILDAILSGDKNLHEFKGDEGQEKYGSVINKIETLKLLFSRGQEFLIEIIKLDWTSVLVIFTSSYWSYAPF